MNGGLKLVLWFWLIEVSFVSTSSIKCQTWIELLYTRLWSKVEVALILFLRIYYMRVYVFVHLSMGVFFSFLTLQLKYFKSNVRKVCCRLGPYLFEVWSLKFFSVPRRIRNFPQNLNHVKAGVNLGLSFLFSSRLGKYIGGALWVRTLFS